MTLIECSPPFQWRPSVVRIGTLTRVMWGWFAIAYFPGDFNDFVEGIARAGVAIHQESTFTTEKVNVSGRKQTNPQANTE